MSPRIRTVVFVAIGIITLALAVISIGLYSDADKAGFSLDLEYVRYQQAMNDCRQDPLACPEAQRQGADCDRAVARLREVREQASLFRNLAIAIPLSAILLRVGWLRFSRSRRSNPKDASLVP